ncbi:peroxiredoxin [Leptolyngbya sp. FACHB-261]|uniref:peroxiredoxin n=1 Tax=Leptolyngbya sp. FACHB-261 TaxID=2692806 RepID=UPI0016836003|nr:peroxiredoxin [Leptolyngbya sp. FACHB-261]MBD2103609.1 peroxiredoxin [Leptolyngbya sp. FACHB-261]
MALVVGEQAPDFSLKDTRGNSVSLSGLAGQKVVLYFYPKDDTPGCTKQACSFREAYQDYLDKGIVVYGVSKDDLDSHQEFTGKYNLPFPLLADPAGEMIKAYDVEGNSGYAQRVTYVIDEAGTIEKVYGAGTVNTETHATDILADLGAR